MRTAIWVTGRPSMVVEAAVAALARRGLGARAWPQSPLPDEGVVLLIQHDHDLDALWAQVETVLTTRRPWVALVSSFGRDVVTTLRELGACDVLRSDAGLDAVTTALDTALAHPDAEPSAGPGVLLTLPVRSLAAERAERIHALTPREQEVLEALGEGWSVARIARHLGSAPSTVRTQIASVRRKLGVRSQLAAVATLHRYRSPTTQRPALTGSPILRKDPAAEG